MNCDINKQLLFAKMDRIEELNQKNYTVHEKFNKAIIRLMKAKQSNKCLKYLDADFYLEQPARKIIHNQHGLLTLEENKQGLTFSDTDETVEPVKGDTTFKYIDTYTKDLKLKNQLETLFSEVLEGYIEYANYLNSIMNKKHK